MLMRTLPLLTLLVACSSNHDTPSPDAMPDSSLPSGVTAVTLAGCGPFYAGTFDIGGSPFRLTIDTGSGTLGVAAAGCTTCSDAGVAPLYTPGSTAIDQHQTGHQTYGDGQMWSGEIYQDVVEAGPGASANVDLVAIASQSNFFGSGECGMPQGILGMAPKAALVPGTTSYMTALAGTGIADEFAIHYCPNVGTLWLGGFDPGATTAAPTFVPMESAYGYFVNVVDVLVDGAGTAPPGTVYSGGLVDSGGPAIVVNPNAEQAIASKLAANPNFQTLFGDATFFSTSNAGNCKPLALTRAEVDAQLTPLTLKLGDGSTLLDLPATGSYLEAYDQGGQTYYCPALFGPLGWTGLDLGNSLVRSYVTIFDREHQRMGFAKTQCY
jgi:hypothetical protein